MGKELSPAQQKKRTTRTYNILTFIFFLLCLAAPVGVLFFSFATITSVTSLPDNTTILNGVSTKYTDPCNNAPGLNDHRPLRFGFANESDSLSCTWPVINNVLHMILGFGAIAIVCVTFVFTYPRRGPLMYLFGTLVVVAGVGFGYIGYDDSRLIALSNAWCVKGMEKVPWVHPLKTMPDCRYSPFIFLAVLDFVSALVCILLAFFAFCFVCRAGPVTNKKKSGSLLPEDNNQDEEEEPNDPFEKLAHKGKDPRDTFGETPEEPAEKPKQKSGGFFGGLFGGGNKKKPTQPESDEGGNVNFEQESKSRFAPMSKTDREVSKKPLGTADDSANGQNVGNALFNFDQPSSSASQPAAAPQPEARPQQPQPAKQTPPAKPQQPQSGGVVDFEALAGAEENPFA